MARYFRTRIGGSTIYNAVSDKPDEEAERSGSFGTYPVAAVEVSTSRAKAFTNFDFTNSRPSVQATGRALEAMEKVNNELGMPNAQAHVSGKFEDKYYETAYHARQATHGLTSPERRYAGIEYAKGMRDLKKGSSEMFTTVPGANKVQSAFSHSRMRHTVPVMLAHAHQHLGDLTASGDLSTHSSKMVKRARAKGFPVSTSESNPDADVTNDYDFNDADHLSYGDFSGYERIPENEIRSAMKHIRTMRKGGLDNANPQQPAHMSPQFEQLRLPGME